MSKGMMIYKEKQSKGIRKGDMYIKWETGNKKTAQMLVKFDMKIDR